MYCFRVRLGEKNFLPNASARTGPSAATTSSNEDKNTSNLPKIVKMKFCPFVALFDPMCRFTLCCVFDRLSFYPRSFYPVSFDLLAFDPRLFDPRSMNPLLNTNEHPDRQTSKVYKEIEFVQ